MKRKIFVILSSLAIIALSVLLFRAMGSGKKESKKSSFYDGTKYLQTDTVVYSTNKTVVNSLGRVVSLKKVDLFTEVTGTALNTGKEVKIGTYFKAGEPILKLDNREAQLQLYSLKSQFLNILTQALPDIKSDYPDAFPSWKKYLDEFEIKSDIEPIPEPKSSKEKFFIAAKNIYSQYYTIRNSEVRLSKYVIVAPFDGVITMGDVYPGSLISIGQRIATFSAVGTYELELSIPSKEIMFIEQGNRVLIQSTETGDTWDGIIKRISKTIDPATQTVKIYAGLSDKNIKDGMYLKASIFGENMQNTFALPRNAIINNSYVNTIVDSTLVLKKVEIVKLSDEMALIRGLQEKTIAVIEPVVNAPKGLKVKPIVN